MNADEINEGLARYMGGRLESFDEGDVRAVFIGAPVG